MKQRFLRLLARRGAVLVTAVAVALSPLALSQAADAKAVANGHFSLGRGGSPDLAVGKDGTAYVAWVHQGSRGVDDQIQFCRVPRGKRACVGRLTFSLPGEQIGERPYVFLPDPSTVLILSYRLLPDTNAVPFYEQTVLLRSTDHGKTFASPVVIGTHSQAGDAKLGAGGSVWTIDDTDTFGVGVQRSFLDGAAFPAQGKHARLGDDEYGGTLAMLPRGGVLAATWDFYGGPNTFHVYRYSGVGDPNTDAAWSTVFTGRGTSSPTSGGKYTQLAQGKRGVYLFTQDNEVLGRFQLRKWTGSTFTKPVFVTPAGQDNIFPNFWQDAAGRLSVVYSNGARVVTYRASDRSGFAAPLTLRASNAYNLRGASAADGGGFVAYDANSESGTVSMVAIPVKRSITESVKGAAGGKVSGKVVAFAAKQPVLLQKKKGKGWVTVKAAKLTAAGKYAFVIPAGKATWRAAAPAVEGYAEADGKPFARH